MSSGTYDIKSYNNKIYIALGKSNTQMPQCMYIDENTFKVVIDSNINFRFHK